MITNAKPRISYKANLAALGAVLSFDGEISHSSMKEMDNDKLT